MQRAAFICIVFSCSGYIS